MQKNDIYYTMRKKYIMQKKYYIAQKKYYITIKNDIYYIMQKKYIMQKIGFNDIHYAMRKKMILRYLLYHANTAWPKKNENWIGADEKDCFSLPICLHPLQFQQGFFLRPKPVGYV